MNRLDREIMIALLNPPKSKYALEKALKKANYATVWRHIKRMQKEGLVITVKTSRKNGSLDERRTEKPFLTTKGLATLLIDGDLKGEKLKRAVREILGKDFKKIPNEFLRVLPLDEFLAETLLSMKPKVNLKFFGEEYFRELLYDSLKESLTSALQKIDYKGDAKTILKAFNVLGKIVKEQGNPQNLDEAVKLGKMLTSKHKKKGE